jgi:hypothetical protein
MRARISLLGADMSRRADKLISTNVRRGRHPDGERYNEQHVDHKNVSATLVNSRVQHSHVKSPEAVIMISCQLRSLSFRGRYPRIACTVLHMGRTKRDVGHDVHIPLHIHHISRRRVGIALQIEERYD